MYTFKGVALRHLTAQAGTPGVRSASRGSQAVWLQGSPQARGHLAIQHEPGRCPMGTGCGFVRAYAGAARHARALQPTWEKHVLLRAWALLLDAVLLGTAGQDSGARNVCG